MQASGNMLNMLLGVAEPTQIGQPNLQKGIAASGLLFGDILGLLTGMSEQKAEFPFAGIDGQTLASESAAQSLNLIAAAKGNVVDPDSNPSVLLGRPTALNPNLQELIANQSVELEEGTYLVLNSRIADDQLQIELQADNADGQKIRISIPVELLEQPLHNLLTTLRKPAVKGEVGVARIPVTPTEPTQSKVADLLARLNLKAIEIANTGGTADAEIGDDTVRVKLVLENAGNEFAIKTNLTKQKLRARAVRMQPSWNNNADLKTNSIDTTCAKKQVVELADTPEKNFIRLRSESHSVTLKNAAWVGEPGSIDILENFGKELRTPETRLLAGVESESVLFDSRLSNKKTQVSAVKLDLPDGASRMLKPNGQSIMIRIEPDHLGPARLNLLMRGNSLTARVTVESVQAQIAVEGSLDQLTEQLSRSGIRVEQIEVSIGGHDLRNQFSDRRAGIPGKARSFRAKLDDTEKVDPATITVSHLSQPVEYVDGRGVNLFA